MNPQMKFLITARVKSGRSRYAIAKQLKQTEGQIKRLEDSGKYVTPQFLCGFRKATYLTWEQLGELLDAEFGESEPAQRQPRKTTK